jgi:hypothetical protein
MANQPFVPSSDVTISLPVAQGRILNWRNYIGSNLDTKAFFISMDDLKILGDILSDIESPMGVRAYLTRNENQENGLALVAVSSKNLDGTDAPNGRDIINAATGDSLICDFTTPCPTICDGGSPLNMPNAF